MKYLWFSASGYPFFIGIFFILISIGVSVIVKRHFQKIFVHVTLILAVFLIFLSATPLSFCFYAIWILSIVTWVTLFNISKIKRYLFKYFAFAAVGLSILAAMLELPFLLMPDIPNQNFDSLYVIGDSVSAGLGKRNEITWPRLLKKKYGVNVNDLSVAGAKVESAINQAKKINAFEAMILIEIGGNDLLSSTKSSKFKENLSQVLEKVSSGDNTVIMLELPLLPRQIKYGRIQRQMAERYGVILIPKRFLCSVFSQKGATIDLAHLSDKGHKLMAQEIWSLIKENFKNSKINEEINSF